MTDNTENFQRLRKLTKRVNKDMFLNESEYEPQVSTRIENKFKNDRDLKNILYYTDTLEKYKEVFKDTFLMTGLFRRINNKELNINKESIIAGIRDVMNDLDIN